MRHTGFELPVGRIFIKGSVLTDYLSLMRARRTPTVSLRVCLFLKQCYSSNVMLFISLAEDMRSELSRLRPGKAAGPDGLSPRVLKVCATQLCGVFHHVVNLSTMIVPVLWKTSCLVPVPKKRHANTLNDYRPVALNSHVMKLLERLVLWRVCRLHCESHILRLLKRFQHHKACPAWV